MVCGGRCGVCSSCGWNMGLAGDVKCNRGSSLRCREFRKQQHRRQGNGWDSVLEFHLSRSKVPR